MNIVKLSHIDNVARIIKGHIFIHVIEFGSCFPGIGCRRMGLGRFVPPCRAGWLTPAPPPIPPLIFESVSSGSGALRRRVLEALQGDNSSAFEELEEDFVMTAM
jgi:hypothetical protein